MFMMLLSSCNLNGGEEKMYTQAEIIADGTINITKAEQSGYFSYDEIADDFQPLTNSKKATAYVKEHYQEIVQLMQPAIAKTLGQEVEVIDIGTPFPYMAAQIYYQTLTYPQFQGAITYALADSLQFNADEIKMPSVKNELMVALYSYAYQPELDQMRTDFMRAFPEFMPYIIGSKSADLQGLYDPFITPQQQINFDQDGVSVINRIYESYQANQYMSQTELRALFEQEPTYYVNFIFNTIMKDKTTIPTGTDWQAIHDFIKNYDKPWMNATQQHNVMVHGNVLSNYHTRKYISANGGRALVSIRDNRA